MTIGSMIEADNRLRQHELWVRTQKKIARDAEVWRRYEADYGISGRGSANPDRVGVAAGGDAAKESSAIQGSKE